jgi:hypothetical protein
MPLTGSPAQIGQIRRTLEKLARVPAAASPILAKKLQARIDAQFANGTDSYGKAWAPTKKGNHPPLTETGALRGSAQVKPLPGAGVSIEVSDFKAPFHQGGTSRMPARPILPTAGPPATWNADIKAAVEEAAVAATKG